MQRKTGLRPTILLGLCTCFKENLNASPAEMLYESTLRISGEFFKTPFFHKNLYDCTHVWVRDDTVRKSLQPPYSGPFCVVERINDYLFTIDISGKTINTECLKSVFLKKKYTSIWPLRHLLLLLIHLLRLLRLNNLKLILTLRRKLNLQRRMSLEVLWHTTSVLPTSFHSFTN
ncbi:hypothetical protein ACFW04_013621 [Cataglyphis niger]